MDAWGPSKEEAFHWGFMGAASCCGMIGDEPIPGDVGEFIAPYDGELLARYGEWLISAGDHFIERLWSRQANRREHEPTGVQRYGAHLCPNRGPEYSAVRIPSDGLAVLRGRVHALT